MIITNNPAVLERYGAHHVARFVRGGYREVLVTVRDLVHVGHELITHPLMGSLKPNETPYRSVIVSDEPHRSIDERAVAVIEEAIVVFDRFAAQPRFGSEQACPEHLLHDYQVIDLSLLASALDF